MTATALDILKAVHEKLTQDTSAGSLAGVLGGRIWMGEAKRQDVFPYLVWSCITDPLTRSFGARTHNPLLQFDIYGAKGDKPGMPGGMKVIGDIAALLYELLDGESLIADGFDRAVVLFSDPFSPGIDEDALRITCEAEITGTDF